MGTAREPAPVKLVAGILAASVGLLGEAGEALAEEFGRIDAATEPRPWTASPYYGAEMGAAIWRRFVAFEAPIHPGLLAEVKRRTNEMEDRWRSPAGRQVNIDPGYLDLNRLVLASTKDAAHRVYLGRGIFAEATLKFARGSFCAYEYTYPDYAARAAIEFFNRVRAGWKRALHPGGRGAATPKLRQGSHPGGRGSPTK